MLLFYNTCFSSRFTDDLNFQTSNFRKILLLTLYTQNERTSFLVILAGHEPIICPGSLVRVQLNVQHYFISLGVFTDDKQHHYDKVCLKQ